MDAHKIDKSIIRYASKFSLCPHFSHPTPFSHTISHTSLANPWLDFLQGSEASYQASLMNDELQSLCEASNGRLHGLATLPVSDPTAAAAEVARLRGHSHIKGVIMGTSGTGRGLDDVRLEPLLGSLQDGALPIFLHPHYGVGTEHFANTGHALFLALGTLVLFL